MYTGSFSWVGFTGGCAGGRSRRIETVAIGAATMKMIMSTSRMSMNGVMLISAVCSIVCLSPPEPPSLAAMHRLRYSPAAFRADISLWIARRLDRFLASRCGLVKRF